jgi:hypothetical protein
VNPPHQSSSPYDERIGSSPHQSEHNGLTVGTSRAQLRKIEGQRNGCCSSSPWRLTDVPEPTHHSPLLGLTIVVISPVQAHLCPRRSSPWSLNPLTQSYGNPHGFELSPRLTCIQCVPRGIQQILKPCVRSSKANRRQTAEHRYQADEWSHHDEGDLNLPDAAKTRGVLGTSPRPSRFAQYFHLPSASKHYGLELRNERSMARWMRRRAAKECCTSGASGA